MNDRFKFRVWNEEFKKYENTFMQFNEEDCIAVKPYANTVIEQCTGIKDRNGKLIYEGDLIQWVKKGEIASQGVVEFCNGDGAFSGSWQAVDYRPNGCGYFLCQHFSPAWKIIGNIHEMEIEK
jgi:uncharacterized phage protein (TIGR01671 family)